MTRLSDEQHEQAISACLRMKAHIRRFELLISNEVKRPNLGTEMLAGSNEILNCALDISKQTARFERAAQRSSGRVLKEG